ncbi:MAG: riboflavin synthase [Proteobacteria bacterium]|nr:MAG: riboflavin synthase [Pseudomonadota bacterium]PIE40435.1 MAG: riboflavin synthase [Gammaproteobacteria bacterium]
MFTGIVQGKAIIKRLVRKKGLTTASIAFPEGKLDNIGTGASVAINGACLTVTQHENNLATFDIIAETLSVTNLGALEEGDAVNFERAARIGDEIGGHLLSGHIHTTVEVADIIKSENNTTLVFNAPRQWLRYILPKGFVGLNGASLTVGAEVTENRFSVHLIPETLAVTTFGEIRPGQRVNLEVDSQTQTIVDTIEQLNLLNKIR